VSAIRAANPLVKTKAVLQPLILDVALKTNDPDPPSFISIYRWLKIFEKSEDPRCLITHHHEKGNCHMKYPQEVHDIIEAVVKDRYLCPERPSVASVYKMVVAHIADCNRFRSKPEKLPFVLTSALIRLIKA
jgi:putative transposase